MQLCQCCHFSDTCLLQSFVLHFVCPHNVLFKPISFSLRLCIGPSNMLCMSPHLVFDCSCIIYSIQRHTKCLSSIFLFPVLPYVLAVGCSILICSIFILLPLHPFLCKLIVLTVFFILFDTITSAHVAVKYSALNCIG
jgi:hypothetical protein